MPRAWLLVTLASLAASLAPLKSFGKTKGRGIRIQDKKGNKNEAVVELFLGTAELETATVGGFTRSQKCVKVDGCAIYGEMNDQDVTRFSGCLGVICPFAAITVARDATDTRKLADALEAARRGAYAVGAEKVSGDAKEGPMGGAYKTLEKARGAVGIFGLDENVAAPKNPLEGLKAPELANPLRDWNPAPRAPAAAPAPLAAAAAAAQAAAEKAEAELAAIKDGGSSSWNPFAKRETIDVDVGPKPNFWEIEKLTAWKIAEAEARREAEAVAEAARDSAIAAATAARDSAIAAARAAAEAAAEAARAETEAAEAARAEAEAEQKAEAAEASARAERDGPAPVVDTPPPEDCDKLPPRLRARRAAEDLLREEDERRRKMAAEASRASTPDEGRSRLEASFAASPDAAPAPTAPPPPSEDAQSEFEKFLANRKAGKSDADYWAARKAEEAPEEEDDDDFLKTIKYRPLAPE